MKQNLTRRSVGALAVAMAAGPQCSQPVPATQSSLKMVRGLSGLRWAANPRPSRSRTSDQRG